MSEHIGCNRTVDHLAVNPHLARSPGDDRPGAGRGDMCNHTCLSSEVHQCSSATYREPGRAWSPNETTKAVNCPSSSLEKRSTQLGIAVPGRPVTSVL